MTINTRNFVVAFALAIASVLPCKGVDSGWTDALDPGYREWVDSISASIGLPPLKSSAAFPDSITEIRIFTGFGLLSPGELVRVSRSGSTTVGMLGLWWGGLPPASLDSQTRAIMSEYVLQVRASVVNSGRCGPIRDAAGFETCGLLRTETLDWDELLRDLEHLGMFELPLQSRRRLGTDGESMVVEIRRGSRYRAYSYWSPSMDWSRVVDEDDAGARSSGRRTPNEGTLPAGRGVNAATTAVRLVRPGLTPGVPVFDLVPGDAMRDRRAILHCIAVLPADHDAPPSSGASHATQLSSLCRR